VGGGGGCECWEGVGLGCKDVMSLLLCADCMFCYCPMLSPICRCHVEHAGLLLDIYLLVSIASAETSMNGRDFKTCN
jgi:hypothetical protein